MVTVELTDTEATELEYAIRHRIACLCSPSVGCADCRRGSCDLHKDMVDVLSILLTRLIGTGFNLRS